MSASSKKKLRKELEAARMTERQEKERKEAKKTKLYTVIFSAIMAAVILVILIAAPYNCAKSDGYFTKRTIAAVTGEHELNSVEMSYFYNDAISSQYNDWYEKYGDYLSFYTSMWGLDLTKSLNEQKYSDDMTWADFFVEQAMNVAKETYALYDKAMAEGLTLTEEQEDNVDNTMSTASMYASLYGYSNLSEYLVALYGYGASEESYRAYQEVSAIAAAYYSAHADSLEYTADDVKAHNDKNPAAYNSYSFNAYFVYADDYLSGGTTAEDGTVTYSDEEKEAARAEAEKVANELAKATTVIELDKLIAALEVNAENESAASDAYTDTMYTDLPETFQEWFSAEGRKIGDITVIADREVEEHEHEEGEEHSEDEGEIIGYYVVIFNGVKFNNEPLANVRHLLVSFEGGTYDSETGTTTYSDEEKAAAKEEAEKYLNEWKQGETTEATFIELVKKYSDDSSKEEGGLFEDITPVSNYVPSFLNWSIDPDRKAGDVEIIESEYGYHIMYYVADDELTYREYMIRNDLKSADMEEWYASIVDPASITQKDISHLALDRSVN